MTHHLHMITPKKLKDTYQELVNKITTIPQERLKTYKTVVVYAILVDLFLFYYFLHWKVLGGTIFIFLIVIFAILLASERGDDDMAKPKKKFVKKTSKDVKPVKKEQDDDDEEEDSGFMNSESYNKKLKAVLS